VKLLVALLIPAFCQASTAAFWDLTSFSDFVKGTFNGVSLGRDGRLSVAPKLDSFFTSQQPVVWSVAAAPDGALYAATGHLGRVFRIETDGSAKLLWTADKPEVFAIAVDKRGILYAASSPDGKIYRIENGKATEYFEPHTKYIWALEAGLDGVLYAGTGDGGKVFRITAAGKGEEYYATGQGNVTSLTLDREGRLLAGTEPNGVLYRITAKDKAFALYSSSLPEIRAAAPNADGSVYAVALGGALAKKVQATQAGQNLLQDSGSGVTTTITVTADAGTDIKPAPTQPPKPQAGPTPDTPAATTTTTDSTNVEKSAIYRINADNTVDTLWSSKEENVYDILPSSDGQLFFGTDSSGRIYRLTSDNKLTLVAQTNEQQATRLLQWRGALIAATGNMGKIYELGKPGASGTWESQVFDAGSVSRWGKLRWQGAGEIAFRTRSGNSVRPDRTWSDWSGPVSDAAQIASPNARYLQLEAKLSGSAAIENISAAYLPRNNPPAIHSITVLTTLTPATAAPKQSGSAAFSVTVTDTGDPAPNSSTGTPAQTISRAASQQIVVSWAADDPDSDKLVYELDFRGQGEQSWKPLRKDLTDPNFTIDGDAMADGRYFFRVIASDRLSNPPASARDAELVSSPVLIDNTPPVVRIQSAARAGGGADVTVDAQDSASALRRAEWSIDAGPWTPVAPVTGVLDSPTEEFRFHIAALSAGEHLLVVRVADSGNNTGLAKVVLH
jgi:hypothetical protein